MRLSPPPSSSSQALPFFSLFLLSLTACRTFGSLHWCIYTLVHTYLRLVLPSLRPLRGLCSSCSRPAIRTLHAVLNISTLLVVLKLLHTPREYHQLDCHDHFINSIFSDVVLCSCESLVISGALCPLRFWLREPPWSSRSTAHCLGSIAESSSHPQISCIHMSVAVPEVRAGCRALRRESPALRRFLVGELPGCQYPV